MPRAEPNAEKERRKSKRAQVNRQPARQKRGSDEGNPGYRKSEGEDDARLEFAVWCRSRMLHKAETKRRFREKFGNLAARTIEDYLSRAKALAMERINRAADEMVAELTAVHEGVIADPAAKPIDRSRAAEALARLAGVGAPERRELSVQGASGTPLVVRVMVEDQSKPEEAQS